MDFYVILGVEREATLADVKRAFKRLARKYHPDINPGDRMAAAHFRQIAEAYETLSDAQRRQQYDTTAFGGWPTPSDPYAQPPVWATPDNGLVLTRLYPVS